MTRDPDPDRSLGWNPDRYDGGHAFVYEYGADLLGLLAPSPCERILDLGCGTGQLAAEIAESGASVVGVDRSAGMLRQAARAFPRLSFARADARSLPFAGTFDAVFSNAVLHWIRDQDAAIDSVAAALRPGGRLVAELGGTGNVASVVRVVNDERTDRGHEPANPWYFPGIGEYATRLEDHGFEVTFARLFDRPTELDGGAGGFENWLRMFGEPLLGDLDAPEQEAVIEAVEDRLRPTRFREGAWVLDYRRLRIVAHRP